MTYTENRWQWLKRNVDFDRVMWHTYSAGNPRWWLWWLIKFYIRNLIHFPPAWAR